MAPPPPCWLRACSISPAGSTNRDFKPLFTNLAAEDAGAGRRQACTRPASNSVWRKTAPPCWSRRAKVDELRLQLAAAGLPKTGRIGYELFDKTNFGVTDFTEQVNYHRALEGELERSVMSLAEVEQARGPPHLPEGFRSSRKTAKPAKASVLVKLRLGAQLSPRTSSPSAT